MMSRPPNVSTAVLTNRSAKPSSVTLADAGDGPPPAASMVGDGLLGGLGVEVVDDDARAFGGELQRDLPADAAAGPGDDRDLVLSSFPCLQSPFVVSVSGEGDRGVTGQGHGAVGESDGELEGGQAVLDGSRPGRCTSGWPCTGVMAAKRTWKERMRSCGTQPVSSRPR